MREHILEQITQMLVAMGYQWREAKDAVYRHEELIREEYEDRMHEMPVIAMAVDAAEARQVLEAS